MPSLSLLPKLTQGVSALSQLAAAVTEPDAQAVCTDIKHCRTIWNIIWSCLATIFACTWVAVHRNVPDPTSSTVRVSLERVAITICALLVPEYMIGWAARQWLVARRITQKNKTLSNEARERRRRESSMRDSGSVRFDKSCEKILDESITAHDFHAKAMNNMENDAKDAGGLKWMWYRFRTKYFPDDDLEWTVTHGFFALMGGFYYLEPGDDPRPLSPKEVEDHIQDGSLELPKKSDINDKSKGDALSKFVASLQTIWFVMQSIARPLQRLPLTKLEIATLAYTSINVAMYIFWWYKPLSVSRPVRVRRVTVPGPTTPATLATPTTPTTTTTPTTLKLTTTTTTKVLRRVFVVVPRWALSWS